MKDQSILLNFLDLIGVETEVYSKQKPAEKSNVMILVLGIIVSPLVSGIVIGVLFALFFQSVVIGGIAGILFAVMLFFFDRSLLQPVPNRALGIRLAMSITIALVLSLGVKFLVMEDRVRSNYTTEIDEANEATHYRKVVLYEEDLFAQRQELEDELTALAKLQNGVRRIDQYQQFLIKRRQLDSFKLAIPQLIQKRENHVENLYQEADLSRMGLFMYMIQTLIGGKGNGADWMMNIFIFFLIFCFESWALIGAVRLRDGEYMTHLEFLLESRLRGQKDNLERQLKLEHNERFMDEQVFDDTSSADELRKTWKKTQLQREYVKLKEKPTHSQQETEHLLYLIDQLRASEEPNTSMLRTDNDVLAQTLAEVGHHSNGSVDENFPPEFDFTKE